MLDHFPLGWPQGFKLMIISLLYPSLIPTHIYGTNANILVDNATCGRYLTSPQPTQCTLQDAPCRFVQQALICKDEDMYRKNGDEREDVDVIMSGKRWKALLIVGERWGEVKEPVS